MPGKCYKCWGNFGLFNKELGCRNCGYSFCKKCLTKKIIIHKTSGEECLVCNKCYDLLSGNNQSTKSPAIFEPPQVLAKRIAESESASQNREKRIIELKKKNEFKSKDDELMARLASLKSNSVVGNSEPKQIPTEEEIESRLKNIKGTDATSSAIQEPSKVLKKDEVESLLDEILDEVYLDEKFNLDDGTSVTADQPSNVEDLIKQVTDEVKSENQTSDEQFEQDKKIRDRLDELKKETQQINQSSKKNKTSASDVINDLKKKWEQDEKITEQQWCCICNEDTKFQCLECDGDLYCPNCFKKGHKNNFDEKHVLVPIKSE